MSEKITGTCVGVVWGFQVKNGRYRLFPTKEEAEEYADNIVKVYELDVIIAEETPNES